MDRYEARGIRTKEGISNSFSSKKFVNPCKTGMKTKLTAEERRHNPIASMQYRAKISPRLAPRDIKTAFSFFPCTSEEKDAMPKIKVRPMMAIPMKSPSEEEKAKDKAQKQAQKAKKEADKAEDAQKDADNAKEKYDRAQEKYNTFKNRVAQQEFRMKQMGLNPSDFLKLKK